MRHKELAYSCLTRKWQNKRLKPKSCVSSSFQPDPENWKYSTYKDMWICLPPHTHRKICTFPLGTNWYCLLRNQFGTKTLRVIHCSHTLWTGIPSSGNFPKGIIPGRLKKIHTYGKIFCDIVKNWKESTFSIIERVKALLIIHTLIMIKLLLYNFEDHVINMG